MRACFAGRLQPAFRQEFPYCPPRRRRRPYRTPKLLRSLTRDPALNTRSFTAMGNLPGTLIRLDTMRYLNPGAEAVQVYVMADALIAPEYKSKVFSTPPWSDRAASTMAPSPRRSQLPGRVWLRRAWRSVWQRRHADHGAASTIPIWCATWPKASRPTLCAWTLTCCGSYIAEHSTTSSTACAVAPSLGSAKTRAHALAIARRCIESFETGKAVAVQGAQR